MNSFVTRAVLLAATASLLPLPAFASTIFLDSIMNGNSFMSEDLVTGSIAQINFGSGAPGDADGLYDINNPSTLFGPIDLFPTETAFSIGSLTYNPALLTGSGVEVIGISTIDLTGLSNDISQAGRDLWFFGLPNSFSFGVLDPSDTLTFTNGALSSIDLSIDGDFLLTDGGGNPLTYDGTFSITGQDLSFQILDTENFDTGFFGVVPSTITADFTGTVSAIPEPSAGLFLGVAAGFLLISFRRRP